MAAITHVHDCDVERRDVPTAAEGDFRDTHLDDSLPTWNFGAEYSNLVGVFSPGKGEYDIYQMLLYFDLKAFIPADATITAAVWWFYAGSGVFDATHTYRIRRCTRADWVEMQATWNIYKTGSNWTAPGGDYLTPTINFGALGTPYVGWHNYSVLAMVTDAWASRGGICTFGFDRYGDLTDTGWFAVTAKEWSPAATPHHLRITYTLDGRTFQVMLR